jgi:hypothetical protein
MTEIDPKKVLTRKEKEEIVLDLYFNQNKTIRNSQDSKKISSRHWGYYKQGN